MSNDLNENSTAPTKEKKSASRFIIPILGGAIVWVGLFGVGLKVIEGMAPAKSTSQPKKQMQTHVSVTPVTNTETNKSNQGDIIGKSRYALHMQDDQGNVYAVYLYAPNETSTVQPPQATAIAFPGDKLFSGDYDIYVGPTDGSDVQKQAVTMSHETFNANRRQAYVIQGNAQLLAVTQAADYNAVTSHFFTLKSGKLVPVAIEVGPEIKPDLYMISMRSTDNATRKFQSIGYDKSSGHYGLKTWQYDPAMTELRQIGQKNLAPDQVPSGS